MKNNSINNDITNDGKIVLKAGSAAANTAPLKFTTQAASLTIEEQGTMELVGNSLQFTQLVKRRGVAMSQSVRITDTQIISSSDESAALLTAEHGPNYLEVGKCEELVLRGTIRKDVTDTMTMRVKYAGVTIQTVVSAAAAIAAGTPFEMLVYSTCRSVGATGTMQLNSWFRIDGVTNVPDSSSLVTIDTTTAQNTTITAQFSAASATNILNVNQGRVLCIETNK